MSVGPHNEPIAIIGIGCRFPGEVSGPDGFWDLLCAGTDATREIPADRWETRKFYDPDPSKLGKMGTRRGGFIDGLDQFDAAFFGISPREAVWLDPQQRLLLRAAWEALEDAGLIADHLAGSDTGVFIGGFTLDYQLLQNYGVQSRYELQAHSATGMMMTMLANRLSYSFDFRGPSLTVDTACSGSLVALHLGAQAIWNGECSLAMVGGVNVMLAPNMTIAESKGGFLSPDGRCKTFDSSANGYARGEGAGVVLLKPLARAKADRDPVYALVRGTAVSQDGHTNGITVPNGASQEAAMRAAYARAGVSPRDVDYVEAHGTGTPVGDPIEAAAIGRVLSTDRPAGKPIMIGSVKTNIGHLEAAAGVAGVIKAALSLKHGRIPAHLHLQDPNPAIPFDQFGLRVPTRLTDWPRHEGPRYAGVNSFGFGGTNAHVVLEGPPEPAVTTPSENGQQRHLIVLSARSADALRDLAASMRDVFQADEHSLADVAFSCSRRRTAHDHRLALVAQNAAEAEERLRAFLDDDRVVGVVTGRPPSEEKPKLAFVCSGMGPQWWNMARQLLETEPVFQAAVDRVDAELRKYTGSSLTAELLATEDESRMPETEVAQPSNFAVQVGLADLWRSWGIEPDAVIGHSAGEVAAQYLAGVLSLEDAVKVVYYRSSLQQRTSGTGRMLAVGMTPETLNQAVHDAGPRVAVAAINSPSAVTLSGDADVLEGMAAQLETFGVFHRFLPVKVPYHSHYMDALRADLESGLADIRPRTSTLPLYSTVTGSRIDGRGADARYWWQNVRATVLFSAAFSQMVDDGYTHFVELSAHPVLASAMKELLAQPEHDGLVVPSLRRDDVNIETLLQSLGSLHCHGHQLRWDELQPEGAGFVKLPNYPWQQKTYWNESLEAREDRHYAPVHPLLGQRMNAAHPTWEHELNENLLPYLKDHRIQGNTVLPGAALIEMALAAARVVYGAGDYGLGELRFHKAVILGRTSDARLRTTLHQDQALVEIASYVALPSGERQWTVHATARLAARTRLPALRDVAGLHVQCEGRQVQHDQFYLQTETMGFQYGPAFQAVRDIVTNDRVAVGRVTIPFDVAPEVEDYLFHPSLVDAAFQVLLIAATPSGARGERANPFLPVGADWISVMAPPSAEMVVIAEVRESGPSRIVSDITVCDPTGRVLVEINGFTAQSLAAAASLSPERIDAGLYELQWQPVPRQDPQDTQPQGGTDDGAWLVFADSGGVAAEMFRSLRAVGRRVLRVTRSETDAAADDAIETFSIDPTDPEQYHDVIRAVQGCTIAKVVHLWSLDTALGEADSVDDLLASQEIGSLSAMRLMQALTADLPQTPKVWFVTRGAHTVGETASRPNVAQAPLWGLGRVVGHQEFLSLWGGLCDLDPSASLADQARLLVDEIGGGDTEDQVAFRDGQRFVNRLVASSSLTPPLPVRLRASGSYLVTGGLGALGLVVARFLVERGARDVVLMGRTPVPPRQSWPTMPDDHPQRHLVDRLLELESHGARISLAAVDVSKPNELADWLSSHRQQGLPPVVGVVHTAGVVDDQLLVRMDAATFTKVLAPKLGGGWQLHRLFRDTPLDFFVLFSSTGSVIASPGQGNYAAGNAFLDALASYRRSLGLPGLSIGWGPWSVGMVEQLNLEHMYARRGIELITPEAGMQILGRVLHQRPPHLVAITADWALARETSLSGLLPRMFEQVEGADQAVETDDTDARAILVELAQATEAEREGILVGCVAGMAAKVLGLDEAQVSVTETLSSLGLDSIMAIEMKHRIDSALQVDISVLDMLQGATISGLAEKLLANLAVLGVATPVEDETQGPADSVEDGGQLDELEQMLAQASPDELELLLRELESDEPLAGVALLPTDPGGSGDSR